MKRKPRVQKEKTITFEPGQNYLIPQEAEVTVVDLGNKVIIKNSWRKPKNLSNFPRVDKSHYQDKKTGDIKEYKKRQYKGMNALKDSMNGLKDMIELNFKGNYNEIFLTLTCDKNVTDIKEIKKYTTKFIRRLKFKYPDKHFEYIYKYERNIENPKWHVHILLKDENHARLFIPNKIICKLWEKGITYAQKVYKGRIKVDENTGKKREESVSNYMSKTTQLYDVPINEYIYYPSQGIKRPTKKKMIYKDAKRTIKNGYKMQDEETILIRNAETKHLLNKHKKETYVRK